MVFHLSAHYLKYCALMFAEQAQQMGTVLLGSGTWEAKTTALI